MKTPILLAAAAALIVGDAARAASLESTSATTTYHRITVDGVGVFYREAGPEDAPTIVLLHGFPSSSREFDTLLPLLATHYHLIAPDFPGFGQSDAPPPSPYAYTFDHLAKTINDLLEQLKISKCSIYLHDYGGPVGFRIILAHPERVQTLIIQNANAYKEGLGAKWASIAQYWADPKAHPEVFDAFVSLAATEQRHTLGTSHPDRYNPDIWTDEYAHLSKPGQHEIQAALLCDYLTNVTSYPAWQAWSCEHKPPTLVIGDGTIPRSLLLGQRLSSAICQMPRSICSMQAISLWMRRTTRLQGSFSPSWPDTRADKSVPRATRLMTAQPTWVGRFSRCSQAHQDTYLAGDKPNREAVLQPRPQAVHTDPRSV
jgi:pimeloyl-ACP methyl ester carboxylesterase